MNERIRELAEQATTKIHFRLDPNTYKHIDDPDGDLERFEFDKEKFAKLIVEETLDQVKERAYYTGDRDWSDDVDRPWIQLEFGYGTLHDAKTLRS